MALKALHSSLERWLHPEHPKARNRRLIALAAAALLAWGVFGGQQGLFALALSQHEKGALRQEIASLEQQNRQLEQQAALLARQPEAYERTARERLLLMRPGEIIYRFH
jgi:cell division protein FtsB